MKVLFVRTFTYVIIFLYCLGGTAEYATNMPSCPIKSPSNFRGSPGSPGKPGQKGEMGESSTTKIAHLEKILTDTQRNLSGISVALRRGFLELDNEWISPLNGFQYKLLTTEQSWNDSRRLCQEMGGDLATHGIQDWETRRIIFDALKAGRSLYYWIGLEDNGHEGSFRWVNGRSSSTRETALWENGQPGGGSGEDEDCCLIYSSNLLTHDYPCYRAYRALCQKPI